MSFARRRSPTTEFDHLCKLMFKVLFPAGSTRNTFYASQGANCYRGGVKPDFVMPDGRWIDFKLRVSYREKTDVAWRPSALYTSLRKYLDHEANRHQTLTIIHKTLHGSVHDVILPITRGSKVLVRDMAEFERRVVFVPVSRLYPKLRQTKYAWIEEAIERLR